MEFNSETPTYKNPYLDEKYDEIEEEPCISDEDSLDDEPTFCGFYIGEIFTNEFKNFVETDDKFKEFILSDEDNKIVSFLNFISELGEQIILQNKEFIFSIIEIMKEYVTEFSESDIETICENTNLFKIFLDSIDTEKNENDGELKKEIFLTILEMDDLDESEELERKKQLLSIFFRYFSILDYDIFQEFINYEYCTKEYLWNFYSIALSKENLDAHHLELIENCKNVPFVESFIAMV